MKKKKKRKVHWLEGKEILGRKVHWLGKEVILGRTINGSQLGPLSFNVLISILYELPSWAIKHINKIHNRFLYTGSDDNGKGVHLSKWE